MKFSTKPQLVLVLVSSAVVSAVTAAPKQPPTEPVTVDSLQYDGQGDWQFLNRPIKDQGLDALMSRGRVRPYSLLQMDHPPAGLPAAKEGVTGSARTIFHDLYTGAEVWRLTSFTNGTVSHAANEPWNANGQLIHLTERGGGSLLMDQETCALEQPAQAIKRWSPTEPYIMFFSGLNDGTRAVWVYDIKQQKAVRAIGPTAMGWSGVESVSYDGKWVCWLEGTQDAARRFGLAATDGSVYRSIRYDGGIVAEQKPATLTPPAPEAEDTSVKGGMHGIGFTRSADFPLKTNINGPLGADKEHCSHFFDLNGKLLVSTHPLSHATYGPDGKNEIFGKAAGVRGRELSTGREWEVFQAKGAEEGHTSWTNDPNWAECSWQSAVGWEILRLSMREDASVIRLCGVCPQDPKATTYYSDPFGFLSPDGTKVMFMSSMTHSMNEYLVVAANPRAPEKLMGEWTPEGFKLTWTPHALSRETKGYRIYQTSHSGQGYRQIAWVPTPDAPTVGSTAPVSFVVPGLKKEEAVCFAVRAQEWSGLLSRYSNDTCSDAAVPVAGYIEPEQGLFAGFKQGFDPINAGDMYYLFVPVEGTKCSVAFNNPNKEAQVWVRVGGANAAFTVNDTAIPATTYAEWTWVNLGKIAGEIKLSSESGGFKLDRVFLAPGNETPTGRGLDYALDASFAAQIPTNVQTKVLNTFAAEVTWSPVAGARYYNVYAADKADFVPAQANLVYSPPVGTERIVDWGLKPGKQYYYKVAAVDYDGAYSQPSAAAALETPALVMQSMALDYVSGDGGSVQKDKTASNGKSLLLKQNETCTLNFNVPVEGDYVIWHQWRADKSDWLDLQIELNGKKERLNEWYHLGGLYGRVISSEWLWTRYCMNSAKKGEESIYHLKAGAQTLKVTLSKGRVNAIYLNRLIITNDQSFVPDGKLCIY